MKPVVSIVLFLVVAAQMCSAETQTDSAAFDTIAVNEFQFAYRITEGHLTAELTYPTTGWIAVGLNPGKMMKGANIIVGYADGDLFVVEDHYGVGVVRHKPDTLVGGTNNLSEASCRESDGITTLAFTIPLDSGDPKDTEISVDKETKIIFAASPKDNLKSKHKFKTKTTAKLRGSSQ